MKEHFTLRYSATEENDSVMELDLSFDNPTDELLVKRIQDWLIAIGKTNIVVSIPVNKDLATDKEDKNFYDVD
jgi:hypothetical protein